jgi:hypothetical protein
LTETEPKNNGAYRDKKDFRRSLITFAAVSSALEESNDFFAGIAPIFATIGASRVGQIFNANEFCADAKKYFGLSMPVEVANHLAPRLTAVGILGCVVI